jgi:hypothetical protein
MIGGRRELFDRDFRGWLSRIAISLAAALLVGSLAFLVARAITDVALFAQQQQFLSAAANALRGGMLGLAHSNLHEQRLRVQQLDAQNEQLSLLIGFGVAALAAVGSYLWMERRSSVVRNRSPVTTDNKPGATDSNGK